MAVSLFLWGGHFSAGVALGGAISVMGFRSLKGVVRRLLSLPASKAKISLIIYHYIRLALVFLLLALVLKREMVDPLSLVLGLSVVVVNLLFATLFEARKIRLEV